MSSRSTLSARAVLVAVLGLLLTAAPALAQTSTPGYQVSGQPVDGGTTIPTAPALGPGRYAGSLPGTSTAGAPGSTVYFRVDLADGERLHVAATAPSTGTEADRTGLDVELLRPSGDRCDGGASATADSDATAVTVTVDPDPVAADGQGCRAPGEVVVSVQRTGSGAGVRSDLPLELLVRVQPPTAGTEQPAATAAQQPTGPTAGGTVAEVTGGTGFGSAPVLAPGVYSDRLAPGQTRYYAVAVDWGQTPAYLVQAGRALTGSQYLTVQLRNPVLQPVQVLGSDRGTGALTGSGTVAVRPANQQQGDGRISPLYTAGTYYLAVQLHGEDSTAPVPLGVQVDAVGSVEPAPQLQVSGPVVDRAVPVAPARPGWTWPVVGLLAVAGLGLVALSRRRAR